MSLMKELTDLISAEAAPKAAAKTGLDQNTVEKLMPMATAMMMSRLGKNAQNPDQANALNGALDQHSGDLLSKLGGLGDEASLRDGQNILGHVFGARRTEAQQSLAKIGGIDEGQAANLMAMVAPMVMGALGQKKQQQGGFDVTQLAGLLGQERAQAQSAVPSQLSGMMQMLDADGDGKVNEELMSMGAKLLGGMFRKK